MKQWHLYDRVYRRWVVFMIGPYDEFVQELKDCGFKYVDDLGTGKGMCVELNPENNTANQNCTMVWLEKYESATLVHEITHLVMMCFDQVDVPISRDNTESFAFYSEYWWTELNKVRRNYPEGNEPKHARN